MATHSNILAWEILWTEKPGGLQSMGSQKRHDLVTKQQHLICIFKRTHWLLARKWIIHKNEADTQTIKIVKTSTH